MYTEISELLLKHGEILIGTCNENSQLLTRSPGVGGEGEAKETNSNFSWMNFTEMPTKAKRKRRLQSNTHSKLTVHEGIMWETKEWQLLFSYLYPLAFSRCPYAMGPSCLLSKILDRYSSSAFLICFLKWIMEEESGKLKREEGRENTVSI